MKVLMVCLGNICRSPTAEAVFRQKVAEYNLTESIAIDSAGTGDWHIGHSPDARAIAAAAQRGIDLSKLKARLVTISDFEEYDYIFAMDKENFKNLSVMSPIDKQEKLSLFLTHSDGKATICPDAIPYEEVPDPYYSGTEGFELVLDLIDKASTNILNTLISKHNLTK
ncbi:low molecular weight phosphotyrosine protein phosphatase [Gammaproteobacteria bacterium]|nr:low molecular weight phosphotyrosine protein phosphatase [Gammaproteobacteria bacterium]